VSFFLSVILPFKYFNFEEGDIMFVGIVQGIGKIIARSLIEKGLRLSIAYPAESGLKVGDSIAVNGCCLTVTHFDLEHFEVELVQETLDKTNLGELSVGEAINIEYSAKIGDAIGGHLVQGHIDTTGVIQEVWADGVAKWIRVGFDKAWQLLVVPKGFITVDGASLTVVEANESNFTLTLIPHTQAVTITQYYKVGTIVNVEFDIVGKQIQRFMEHYNARKV
jgi:riboflavin synthase